MKQQEDRKFVPNMPACFAAFSFDFPWGYGGDSPFILADIFVIWLIDSLIRVDWLSGQPVRLWSLHSSSWKEKSVRFQWWVDFACFHLAMEHIQIWKGRRMSICAVRFLSLDYDRFTCSSLCPRRYSSIYACKQVFVLKKISEYNHLYNEQAGIIIYARLTF